MKNNKIKIVFSLLLMLILNSFSVFGVGDVEFWDDYDVGYSTNYDSITWINTGILTYLTNYEAGTMVACWDWDGDGVYSHCFSESGSDLGACRSESSTLDSYCAQGKCFYTGDLGAKHWMEVDLPVGKYMRAKYYVDCGLPGYSVEYPALVEYYIIQDRWYICESRGGEYWDLGDYNDPNYLVWIAKDISCSANYGCDYDKSWADFGNGFSVPSAPCSKLNDQSCSSDSECVYYCSPSGTCVAYECGDDYCDKPNNEWCSLDSCYPYDGTCGGYPEFCNTCDSNQCASDYWYNQDNGNGDHQYCYNNNDLCCSGDSTFGQYYCMNNEEWAVCTSNYHNICEPHGNYYCTYQGGKWRWRECPYGCDTGTKICKPPPIYEPNIAVSPSTLNFEIGYGD